MSWFTSLSGAFWNAGLLWGAGLVALPILIHLINRLRFRRVKWAAMEFLLESQHRNRRRVLFEQLLLLLLRIAAVLAVVALVARPVLNAQQLSLFLGQKTHHLALVDDSVSLQDRNGDAPAFASALDVVRKIAAEGARRPGAQTLTVLLASRPHQPITSFQTITPQFLGELDRMLENVRCSHRQVDLAAGITEGRKLLAGQPGELKTMHFISDFRDPDWSGESAVAGALRECAPLKISVNLVKTVAERHMNLGIVRLSGQLSAAAANVPLTLQVQVTNFGEQVAEKVRLSVLADGKRLPLSVAIDKLEPGTTATRDFEVVFPQAGPHDVRLELPADAYEPDNSRYLALQIPETIPVLIIDGNPASDASGDLANALAPATTRFIPTLDSPESLRRRPLQSFRTIFLLNVAELSPDAVEALERFVAEGGGLAWYLGDQVRGAFYNDSLYRDGRGIFPARLGPVATLAADETDPAPDLNLSPHPCFRVLMGDENPFINLLRVSRYFSVAPDWTPPSGVRILGRLRNKAPLFFEHSLGQGTIITCLTTCGSEWNNWVQIGPSYVTLQLEMQTYLSRKGPAGESRITGQPIDIALDASVYSPQVELQLADGVTERVTAVLEQVERDASTSAPPSPGTGTSAPAASPSPPGAKVKPSGRPTYVDQFLNTDRPGLYNLIKKPLNGPLEEQRFAYNVPAAESDLTLATDETIRKHLGTDLKVQIQEVGNFGWLAGEQSGQQIYDLVLLGLLFLLVVEQLLACRLSFHPHPAGAGT